MRNVHHNISIYPISIYLAKYLSLIEAGTWTPDTSTLVEVARRNL